MKVKKIIYDDGSELELEGEKDNIIKLYTKTSPLEIIMALYYGKPEKLWKVALKYYWLTSRLMKFWVQLGCPRLPSVNCKTNNYLSYKK